MKVKDYIDESQFDNLSDDQKRRLDNAEKDFNILTKFQPSYQQMTQKEQEKFFKNVVENIIENDNFSFYFVSDKKLKVQGETLSIEDTFSKYPNSNFELQLFLDAGELLEL